jgi:hypothetical protein
MESSNRQGAPRPNAALRQRGQNLTDFTSWLKKCRIPGLAALRTRMGKSMSPRGYSFFA